MDARRQAAKGKDALNKKKQARTEEARARKLKKVAEKAERVAAKANAEIEAIASGATLEPCQPHKRSRVVATLETLETEPAHDGGIAERSKGRAKRRRTGVEIGF